MSARPYPPGVLASLELGVGVTETIVRVNTFSDGAINVVIRNEGIHVSPQFTLGQTIQLRDFLNRHIDELALKQTGSLAERASDDPTQLASVEEISHTAIGGEVLEPVKIYGCGRRFRPLHQNDYVRCGDLHGTMRDQRHLCIQCRAKS